MRKHAFLIFGILLAALILSAMAVNLNHGDVGHSYLQTGDSLMRFAILVSAFTWLFFTLVFAGAMTGGRVVIALLAFPPAVIVTVLVVGSLVLNTFGSDSDAWFTAILWFVAVAFGLGAFGLVYFVMISVYGYDFVESESFGGLLPLFVEGPLIWRFVTVHFALPTALEVVVALVAAGLLCLVGRELDRLRLREKQ